MSEKITREIMNKFNIDREIVLFNNKFYMETDSCYCGLTFIDKPINETILVLDAGKTFSDEPYFSTMSKEKQLFLYEYFSTYPLHLTNRATVNSFADKERQFEYKPIMEEFINNYLRPKVILIFSKEAFDYLSVNFKFELKDELEPLGFSKGFVEIWKTYYFFYYIKNLDVIKDNTKKVRKFVMSASIFDHNTAQHLNYIRHHIQDLKFPSEPIHDATVRYYLKSLKEISFFSLPNIHPEFISGVVNSIEDFDLYDLIISNYLNDYSHQTISIGISKENYFELRKNETSKNICLKYFDAQTLNYQKYILQLSLIRYFLYVNYPELSFKYVWHKDKELKGLLEDNYKDSLSRLDEFLHNRKI